MALDIEQTPTLTPIMNRQKKETAAWNWLNKLITKCEKKVHFQYDYLHMVQSFSGAATDKSAEK